VNALQLKSMIAATRYSRVSEFTSASLQIRGSRRIQKYPNVTLESIPIAEPNRQAGERGEGSRRVNRVPAKRETKCLRQKWANEAHSIGFEAVRYVTRMSIIYVVLLGPVLKFDLSRDTARCNTCSVPRRVSAREPAVTRRALPATGEP